MSFPDNWMWHFFPLFIMLGVVALNHLIVHFKAERRYELEASRLRSALIAELQALRKLYRTNLDLIEQKANYVLSTRSSAVIYKGNLGRFTSLFEPLVIERLVTLFAENETVEAHLAAQATSKGGISYQLTADSKVDELKQMYRTGVEDIQSTCEELQRHGRSRIARSPEYGSELLASFDRVIVSCVAPLIRGSTERGSR